MSGRNNFSEIAFIGREIEGPYTGQAITDMIPKWVGSVLDVGCGKGAILKLLGRDGVGVDLSEASVAYAKAHVPGCEFFAGRAKEVIPNLSIRPDLIVNMGASQAIGTQSEALGYFANLLKPGKLLLFGDGIWDRQPSQAYLDFLGAKENDFGTYPEPPALR